MTRVRIVHLVDDTTAGGVMRVLDHIVTAPAMAQTGDHSLRCIDRGSISVGRINADIIVSHLAVSWRTLPMLLALRAAHPGTPLVHVEHSYTEGFVTHNVTRKRRFTVLLRTAYALFNKVVAVSHAQARWLAQSVSIPSTKLTVIQSCVDLSSFRALAAPAGPVRVIGAIGRLDRQKGFDTLITAFRQAVDPAIALHIYGDGAEAPALRACAGDDPRIKFMGYCDDQRAVMAGVDAVVMPSRWEAYGLVAIEALAARRVLLVNDIDGLKDHVPHGAIAVADASVAGWARTIEALAGTVPLPPTVPSRACDGFEEAFARSWQKLITPVRGEGFVACFGK